MGNKPLLLVFGLLWAALTASPASALVLNELPAAMAGGAHAPNFIR